jgi:hypothetical protein
MTMTQDSQLLGTSRGSHDLGPASCVSFAEMPDHESHVNVDSDNPPSALDKHHVSLRSALLTAAGLVGSVEGGAGAVEGCGDEMAVDLVGDLDALVAEPAGDVGDRDALG